MNAPASHPSSPAAGLSRCVLSKEGIECSLLALAPGEHTSFTAPQSSREHVLIVVEGGITLHLGELTFLVKKDDAVQIPAGQEHTIAADPTGWSKLWRIDFAARETPELPIYTFADA